MLPDAPPYLDLFFRPGVTTVRDPEEDRVAQAWAKPLGRATFDGILACDPFDASMPAREAGDIDGPPVVWPGPGALPRTADAFALVADFGLGGQAAALLLRFDGPAVPPARWARGEATAYTDCDTAGFVSAPLRALIAEEKESDALRGEFDGGAGSETGIILEREGQSIVVAQTPDEGGYETWWGLARDGQPVCLAVDFELLTRSVFQEARVPLPVRRGTTRVSGLPGVRVRAGLLRPSRLTVTDGALSPGEYVYVRVADAAGVRHAPALARQGADGLRFDLRTVPAARELIIRRVTGTAPMEIDEG